MSGSSATGSRESVHCDGPAEARRLFLDQLEAIEEIVGAVCRRWRFTGEQAEDFDSVVKLHLIRRDYQVLRRFRGGCQLSTYLTRVISNLARDHQAKERGRFRSSGRARSLGVEAVELERLIYCEARGHEEAIDIVLRRRPRTSRRRLESLIARLPVRFPRRTISLESLDRPWLEVAPEDRVQEHDRLRFQRRLRACLAEVESRLPHQDRRILQLRFVEGLSVAEVARRLDLEQQPLYPRCVRILRSMRRHLEASGFAWRDVSRVVGWDTPKAPESGWGGAPELRIESGGGGH